MEGNKEEVFEYAAHIASIDEKDAHNNPRTVTIAVSVGGKYKFIRRNVFNWEFTPKLYMNLVCVGCEQGEKKWLEFRICDPAKLTDREKEIISSL